MLLADQGAQIIRIVRKGDLQYAVNPVIERGRSNLALDLKDPGDIEKVWAAIESADILIEGFRPGVMERLGLGPEIALQRNPRLIYGRMTGWGQDGPLAMVAGHDINFIALSGALAAIGEGDRVPRPPLNLLGDYGGGSLYLAFGLMAAIVERHTSGRGQVVDAAIVDGTASMMALFMGMLPQGLTDIRRGKSLLGGGAPYYRCFECADGREISIGALEPQFMRTLVQLTGLPPEILDRPYDADYWEQVAGDFEAVFQSRTLAEWSAIFEGHDVCFAPVLTVDEAAEHPHLAERQTYIARDGFQHPAPAPRFSRTRGAIQFDVTDGDTMLAMWTQSTGT